MLKSGILNPHILHLLARVRHTNTLVISDRGFPFWPQIETVDISLVDDIPTVRQVLAALQGNFKIGAAFMAEEFLRENSTAVQQEYAGRLSPITIAFEPHVAFKRRVPSTIGLIRTADTTQYGNIIIESDNSIRRGCQSPHRKNDKHRQVSRTRVSSVSTQVSLCVFPCFLESVK